ncbi:hypothetical protein COCON_G00008490 [Conger conger]|uniref:Jacalin-type lectin domain-containing protein n=1 Tax=Conger conger TaxID=82655 RepID=A0A9Q1E224_CONCO|nr:hypothetical protein COCON_G00008490 [Conger conger]
MISIFIFCLCCLTAGARNLPYHFSGAVGRGSGTSFTSDPPNTGTGRITGVKVWELNNGYIRGLQIKHDYDWGELFGRNTDIEHEFILFEHEVIVQVSGKYNPGNWIYLLTFGTNWGRTFTVGQASGISFNFFQAYPLQELVMVSGRFDNNGLSSIAAHWGVLDLGSTDLPYHFSGAVGRGSGTSFTSDPPNTGTGRITGVKVWELNNGYIRGLQIKHDYNWGELFGRNTDIEHEFILFEREVIVQVSGKYNPGNWIYLLTFGTNWGRTFTVGQASGISFNFFQDYPLQELVMVSGRFDNNGLTSIAAHWGILDLGYTGKNESDVAHH